jgi:chitin synthase
MNPARGFQDVDMTPCARASSISPLNLICVTVYNEALGAVAGTLASLLVSLAQARTDGLRGTGDSCVALILDGPEKADSQVLGFLREAGLLPADPNQEQEQQDRDTQLSFSRRCASTLPWHMANAVVPCDDLEEMAFVVCVKDRNRGKLHSHALFFGNLCARLSPRYCYQIDAGTVIAAPALGAMLAHFDSRPGAGALASCVVSQAAWGQDGLLKRWQFMDFSTQAAVFWPAEILSGHLSVLPGQFCAIRWAALGGTLERQPLNSEKELQRCCALPSRSDPLAGYLRGLGAITGMDRVMFLAEDRIIGNEIILAARKWTLEFCPAARATTDACEQAGELLRQRRRWNNSATACKLWLFGRWLHYLHRKDRDLSHKLRFSMAMIWQLALIVQQLAAPAFLACMALLVGQAVIASAVSSGPLWPGILLGATALGAALSAPSRRSADGRVSAWRVAVRDLSFLTAVVLLVSMVAGFLPAASTAALYAPMAVAAGLTCALFKGQRLAIARRAPEYFVIVNPLMQVYLWAYALAHLNDVTWGTKGLTAHERPDKRMRAARTLSVTAWVAFNAGLLWIALTIPPFFLAGLNPVIEVLCALFALAVGMALWPCLRGLAPVRQQAGKPKLAALNRAGSDA